MDSGTETTGYQRLEVWQLAKTLAVLVYQVSENLPASESFGLKAQIRRSAVSVPSNIAEGYGRRSPKYFANSLRIALGSLAELETQALIGSELGLFQENSIEQILTEAKRLGVKLNNLLNHQESQVREEILDYDVNPK